MLYKKDPCRPYVVPGRVRRRVCGKERLVALLCMRLKGDLQSQLYPVIVRFSRLLILYGIVVKKDHVIMLPIYMVGIGNTVLQRPTRGGF